MRRAFLLAGIAAGAVALFTTGQVVASSQRSTKIETFKTRLADLTFCRTGFEIMSSRPHYMARFVDDAAAKAELLKFSDEMNSKKEQLDGLIADTIKEARDLPLDSEERNALIEKTRWDAELDAVHTTGWVEEPKSFLDHINERCEPYSN